MTKQYCTARTMCLLGMMAGVVLCIMGDHYYTWLVMDTENSGVVPQNSSVVSAGMSPRVYWAKLSSGKMESHNFASENLAGTEWLALVRTNINWCLLEAVCSILLLSLSCSRFFLLVAGSVGFLAVKTGMIAIMEFHLNTDTLTESLLGFPLTSYGWAFYVFCAGVGALGFASVNACFPSPDHADHIGPSASTNHAVNTRCQFCTNTH